MSKTPPSVRGQRRRSDQAPARALVALTVEKRVDAITVQQVLDRRAVGRTTFYARYRGKDDRLTQTMVRA